jgi:arylformamidase
MTCIDLSVSIGNDLLPYPGDPAVLIKKIADIDNDGMNLTEISMSLHSGTHADLPVHYIKGGMDAGAMPIDHFFGKAVMIRANVPPDGIIQNRDVDLSSVGKDDIVIIATSWEKKFGASRYFADFPTISPDLAQSLVNLDIKALGTDLPSVDAESSSGDAHKILLGNDIPIIESLINLSALCGKKFDLFCVPLRINGSDGSPVRAFAVIHE